MKQATTACDHLWLAVVSIWTFNCAKIFKGAQYIAGNQRSSTFHHLRVKVWWWVLDLAPEGFPLGFPLFHIQPNAARKIQLGLEAGDKEPFCGCAVAEIHWVAIFVLFRQLFEPKSFLSPQSNLFRQNHQRQPLRRTSQQNSSKNKCTLWGYSRYTKELEKSIKQRVWKCTAHGVELCVQSCTRRHARRRATCHCATAPCTFWRGRYSTIGCGLEVANGGRSGR